MMITAFFFSLFDEQQRTTITLVSSTIIMDNENSSQNIIIKITFLVSIFLFGSVSIRYEKPDNGYGVKISSIETFKSLKTDINTRLGSQKSVYSGRWVKKPDYTEKYAKMRGIYDFYRSTNGDIAESTKINIKSFYSLIAFTHFGTISLHPGFFSRAIKARIWNLRKLWKSQSILRALLQPESRSELLFELCWPRIG